MIITQFMMTKFDVTIPDAFEVYDEIRSSFSAAELPYVGFKNVGHSLDRLHELGKLIVDDGRKLIVEVVGSGSDSEREAAELAVDLGAELLIGGTHSTTVLPIIRGSGIGYHPSVGDLLTEPGRVHGTIDEIVNQAREAGENPNIDGIMLLGYRFVGDVSVLLREIGNVPGIKVVNAGTVDSAARINELKNAGFWAFTIGSAVLDKTFPAGPTLREQLDWVHEIAK